VDNLDQEIADRDRMTVAQRIRADVEKITNQPPTVQDELLAQMAEMENK
jgi:hypothetical protein